MSNFSNNLDQIEHDIREEARLGEVQMKQLWNKPLRERIESCRALGFLTVSSIDHEKELVHFDSPLEDFAFFNEFETVRVSLDSPEQDYINAEFIGITEKGLTIKTKRTAQFQQGNIEKWSIDQTLVDLSSFYLRAMAQLKESAHGRNKVYPTLFEKPDFLFDAETYDETMDSLEEMETPLNESQIDAVAGCLASTPFHLVQGPPGTGKTYALARLVQQLVKHGHRVIISAFTHRSIHQALTKIHDLIGDECPIIKISGPVNSDKCPFPTYENIADSPLKEHDGPYIIGATPFALWTKRLESIHFDSAILDETSQMTLPAAIMVMLRSDRWFFFGDHRQLPPVSLLHHDDPSHSSVFSKLRQQCEPSSLDTTYRLNQPLTQWPSESFYNGELESSAEVKNHRFTLKSSPTRYRRILAPETSLIRIEIHHENNRSRSDDEADIIADIIFQTLLCGTAAKEIGVIVPFRAQAALIRRLLRGARFTENMKSDTRQITVDTVERFQGQEREMIFYSFTSSDTTFINRLSSFLFQPQRLNVAVTRARTKVILLHSNIIREYAEIQQRYSEPADVFMTLLNEAENIQWSDTEQSSWL